MPHSRLRLRRRVSPFALLLPSLRWLAGLVLLVALLAGGYRWLTRPATVGALEFTPHVIGTATSAVGVQGVAVADMDGDGDQDIATAGSDDIKIYQNDGSNNFTMKVIDDQTGQRIQAVDLNADGSLDLLVTTRGANSVRWYQNNGQLEFSGTILDANSNGVAFAGDINADGFADVVSAADSGGLVVLRRHMNNGSGTFTATTLDSDSGVGALTIGDVDSNGYRDIVTGGSRGLQRWGTSNGTTWNEIDIDSGNENRTHLVTADVNGDGKIDIVSGDQNKDLVAYYRNQDNTAFQRIALTGDADATTVAVVDLDEDGDEDIVASGQDNNNVYWYENDGSDSFTQRTIASNLQSVAALAVADVDKDDDFDFVTGDMMRGTVWWYERVRAKPVATAPSNIKQTTDGTGRITFDTTVSDEDRDASRIRVQYSLDGDHWYKPWIVAVSPSAGSVNLKNSDGYQVGTSNSIDTDANSSVKLTLTWDTKSVENTGGPIVGHATSIKLRVIPRDSVSVGLAAVSSGFEMDNKAPLGLEGLTIDSISEDEATLRWHPATDGNAVEYKLYYGTDHAAVLERRSSAWDSSDDEAMGENDTATTKVTGLTLGERYTFKLFVKDKFGNSAAAPSVRGTTTTAAPTSTPSPGVSPTPSPVFPTPTISPEGVPTTSPSPGISPIPTASPTSTPTVSPTASVPPTLERNRAPVADAGPDQVVNPSALVILDGAASSDPDEVDRSSLIYNWRQLSGPKVDLISQRAPIASFSAGGENETYIFGLTVRDTKGASSTDTVTIATRSLPVGETVPVEVGPSGEEITPVEIPPSLTQTLLGAVDVLLFALSLLATAISLLERLARSWRERRAATLSAFSEAQDTPKGKVVHYKNGEPVVGAQVLIYGEDGKLRATQRTNVKGEFATLFPAGQYTIGVQAEGFSFAPTASAHLKPEGGVLYTGGRLTVRDSNQPLEIVVPMKPIGQEVSSGRARILHLWQTIQHLGRILSWPIFIAGALLNTVLIFWVPSATYLAFEVLYVVLVIIKIVLEVRVRPAYGVVRDAITHVPLDLAVVRLFEQGTNRLVMTRVTNTQGKFFALPSAGTYTITVAKPGYGVFSRQNIEITAEQDSALQMTVDLMPVAPAGGLAQARAAVL